MSRQRFTDQVVFVTGGTSGLGAETSQLFVDEGAKVFVTDLEERSILKRLGPNAFFMRCDVSKPEDCEAAINACIEKWGRLDVMFHNAGRLAPVSTVVDHDVALFQQVINTNLCSAFYLARIAIPQMRKQGKGAIINTASTAALSGDYGVLKSSILYRVKLILFRALRIQRFEGWNHESHTDYGPRSCRRRYTHQWRLPRVHANGNDFRLQRESCS